MVWRTAATYKQTATASGGFEVLAGDREKLPSQVHIDMMFHAQCSATGEDHADAQTDNTSLVDGNDSDDIDAPFDNATDS